MIRYTDLAVVCDRCHQALWGSHADLPDGMTVKMVRDAARRSGWVHYVRQDYCPVCVAGDVRTAASLRKEP